MALDTTKKKRNLLNIVDRLVEKTEAKNEAILRKKQEVLLPSPRSVVSIKSYLLPPTPSSGPTSPSISDQESISDVEEQVTDKGAIIDDEIEEIKKDPGVPKQPLRCDVCGLRVYKSYRFANRTSAPLHLKNFITPENDRIRVCKRCFSSRERCRQNLALVLLRSKTREMIHLRTPLGVTHNRATKAMDYIARDLKKGFKRPYEDLLCDETMVDEDEMEVDDEGFLLNGDASKNQDVMSKLFALEKENAKQGVVSPTPIPVKNAGIVTVVKHHNGKYNSTPNCFTTYEEINNLKIKEDVATTKAGEQNENSPAINATENLKKLVDQNPLLPLTVSITTSSEINTISNKLTFLDHAYALPPPKGKVPSVPKTQAVTKIKSPVNKIVKATDTSKQESQKKTASPDGQTTNSERTCGIVCFLCDNLVTKSYSCYKKENAPEKINHLFTPGVKIVKVCRRCMPYKKPKEEDANAGTGKAKMKVVKGKLAKIKSLKLVKNAKSTGKANTAKISEKKVPSVKSLPKDDKKRKEDKSKVVPAKKQYTVVVQTKKLPTSKVPATKDSKLNNTKTIQVMMGKFVIPRKEETKLEGGKSVSPKGTNAGSKVVSTAPKNIGQKNDKEVNVHVGVAEKSKNNSIVKENSAANKLKSAKVDFGTQSMKSMIGISKVRTKAADSASSNEKTVKENKPASLSINEKVEDKSKNKEVVVKPGVTVKVEKVTEKTESTTSGKEGSTAEKVTTNNVENNSQTEKEDSEHKLKKSEEGDKMDVNQEKSEGLLKEIENAKTESKSTEEKSKDEKGETITENVTEGLNTRETRSASKSPIRAREIKLAEVPSPRRGRSTGTPDKNREDYKQIVPTVRTRKRLASFSDSEVEKKAENDTAVGGKRCAVVALLEKMSRKSGESSSAQSVVTTKVKEENTDVEAPEEEEKGHSMTRRNQMPIKCPGCNEKVVKSYRCFTRTNAPNHIKQLFKQQENPVEMLRVCRKCVKRKAKP